MMKIKRIYYLLFLLIFIQCITITAMHNDDNNNKVIVPFTTCMVYPYIPQQQVHYLAVQSYMVNHKNNLLLPESLHKTNMGNKSIIDDAISTKKNPLTCSMCNKVFKYKSDYKIHLIKHSDEKPYECITCGSTFKHKSNYTKHCYRASCNKELNSTLTNEKTYTEKSYLCQICKKGFSSRQIRWRHIKTHTGKKLYTCNLCDKSFSNSSNYEQHLQTHDELFNDISYNITNIPDNTLLSIAEYSPLENLPITTETEYFL